MPPKEAPTSPDNLTTIESTTFDEAFGRLEQHIHKTAGRTTVVFDLDGVFNEDGLFDWARLALYQDRLNRLHDLVNQYPELQVIIITSRLSFYSRFSPWLDKLKQAITPDGQNTSDVATIQLTNKKQREQLQEQGIKQSAIITNANKKPSERKWQGLPIVRKLIERHQGAPVSIDEKATRNALEAIIASAQKQGRDVYIFDEGNTMLEDIQEIHPNLKAPLRTDITYSSISRKFNRKKIDAETVLAGVLAFLFTKYLLKYLEEKFSSNSTETPRVNQ